MQSFIAYQELERACAEQFEIPCDPGLIGARAGFQGVDLGATGGCPSPQLTASDTVVLTIG